MDPLFRILLTVYGTEQAVAAAFGLERAAHFRKKVPEKIALLAHLSADIPYIYQPNQFGRDDKGLNLNLKTTKKVTTNDHTKHIRENAA